MNSRRHPYAPSPDSYISPTPTTNEGTPDVKRGPAVIVSKRRRSCVAEGAGQAFRIWGTLEQMQPVLTEGVEEVGVGGASPSKEEAGCGVLSCLLPFQLGRRLACTQ